MLSNEQIEEVSPRMNIPLVYCGFKDKLPRVIEANKSYVINLQNALSDDGTQNEGSHWTCFQVGETPNGKRAAFYFDSYGVGEPQVVKQRIHSTFGPIKIYQNKKDVQSLMMDCCGYYCLAFLHYINDPRFKTGNIKSCADNFLDMFVNLEKCADYKMNEHILRHFFLAKDESLRKPINVFLDTDEIIKSNGQMRK